MNLRTHLYVVSTVAILIPPWIWRTLAFLIVVAVAGDVQAGGLPGMNNYCSVDSIFDAGDGQACLFRLLCQRLDRRTAFACTLCRHSSSLCGRSEEHTSELQSLRHIVCSLLLEKEN